MLKQTFRLNLRCLRVHLTSNATKLACFGSHLHSKRLLNIPKNTSKFSNIPSIFRKRNYLYLTVRGFSDVPISEISPTQVEKVLLFFNFTSITSKIIIFSEFNFSLMCNPKFDVFRTV